MRSCARRRRWFGTFLVLLSVSGASLLASAPDALAQTSQYTLAASPATVDPNGTVTVTWTAPVDQTSPTDWIGFYKVGSDNWLFLEYKYTKGLPTGQLIFFAPFQTGTYEFRYGRNNSFNLVAFSNPVTVGNVLPTNRPPTVSLAQPSAGQSFSTPATIELTAAATDPDGSVSKVEFFQGTSLLGTATTSPYTMSWSNVAAGTYSLTARATDSAGASSTSSPAVSITVTAGTTPPPAGGYTISVTPLSTTPGAPVTVTWTTPATVTDFTNDWIGVYAVGAEHTQANLIENQWKHTDGCATGSLTFTAPATAGTYEFRYSTHNSFTKVATSAPLTIGVGGGTNQPPTVSLTSPTAGANFTAPARIDLAATATDADGIKKVEFLQDGIVLPGPVTAGANNTYTLTRATAPAGRYLFSARATDNQGSVTTSQAVTVTVNTPSSSSDTTPPRIERVLPAPSPTLFAGDAITISASVVDDDPSPLDYQFSIDERLVQPWGATPTYRWTTDESLGGPHTLKVEVRDAGGTQVMTNTLYLYRKPPGPP